MSVRFREGYLRFEKVFSEVMIYICVAVFAVMVFSVSYGVLGRYLTFVRSPKWTQELATLCLVWLAFVSAGYAIKEDKHVRMTVINRVVPEKVGKILHAFAFVLLIFVNVFWIIYGTKLTILSQSAKMAATGWPMSITYVSVTLGGIYGAVMAIGRFIKGGF